MTTAPSSGGGLPWLLKRGNGRGGMAGRRRRGWTQRKRTRLPLQPLRLPLLLGGSCRGGTVLQLPHLPPCPLRLLLLLLPLLPLLLLFLLPLRLLLLPLLPLRKVREMIMICAVTCHIRE